MSSTTVHISLICCLLILSILPIFDIIASFNLLNVVCINSLIPLIDLRVFLLCKGIFTLLHISLITFFKLTRERIVLDNIVIVCYIITGAFNVVWLVLGSLLFWRDCPRLVPRNLNIYVHFTIIFGYFSLFGIFSNTLTK